VSRINTVSNGRWFSGEIIRAPTVHACGSFFVLNCVSQSAHIAQREYKKVK